MNPEISYHVDLKITPWYKLGEGSCGSTGKPVPDCIRMTHLLTATPRTTRGGFFQMLFLFTFPCNLLAHLEEVRLNAGKRKAATSSVLASCRLRAFSNTPWKANWMLVILILFIFTQF